MPFPVRASQTSEIFSLLTLLTVISLCLVSRANSGATKGIGFCPIKESIKNCLPKCISDYECIGNKRCCPNICNSKSCADVNAVYSGNDARLAAQNEAITCGNVKCQPQQKCTSDGPMKRPKCSW